jgi:hypothetical protein
VRQGLSWNNFVLRTVETLRDLIRSTSTAGGLEVSVSLLRTAYRTGLRVNKFLLQSIHCLHDRILGNWNYQIHPCTT